MSHDQSKAQLGEHIKIVRKSLGLTQTEFGRLLGTHYMTVSKWERGVALGQPLELALVDMVEVAIAKGSRDAIVARFHESGPLRALYEVLHAVYKV